MTKPIILIIEDDDLQFEIYEEALSAYELIRVRRGTDALTAIPRVTPDVLLLDHILDAGERGLDFLPQFKELLPKPVDVRELRATVATALKECGQAEVVRQFEALERSKRLDAGELLSRSTDRLSRQNRIVEQVSKSKARPNISGLARQFGVARRTIIRDLQELIRRGQLKPEIYPEWENPLPEE
jgi:DNA-binding NtrC family response regulator